MKATTHRRRGLVSAALVLLAAPLLLGLGPSDYPFTAHDGEGGSKPRCKPRADKAIVYFVREVDATPGFRFPVWANCRYVGVLKGVSYFCASVDPGWTELIVTSAAGTPEMVIRARLEPGETYYFGMGHFEIHPLAAPAAEKLIDGRALNLRARRDDTSKEARRCPGGRSDEGRTVRSLYTEVETKDPLRVSLASYEAALFSLETDDPIARDVLSDLEKEMLDALAMRMVFPDVFTKWSDDSARPDLRIKAKVTEFRGVSRFGRAVAGVFAGRAHITIDVRIYDVRTKKRLAGFVVKARSAPDGTIPHGTTDDAVRGVLGSVADHLQRLKRIVVL